MGWYFYATTDKPFMPQFSFVALSSPPPPQFLYSLTFFWMVFFPLLCSVCSSTWVYWIFSFHLTCSPLPQATLFTLEVRGAAIKIPFFLGRRIPDFRLAVFSQDWRSEERENKCIKCVAELTCSLLEKTDMSIYGKENSSYEGCQKIKPIKIKMRVRFRECVLSSLLHLPHLPPCPRLHSHPLNHLPRSTSKHLTAILARYHLVCAKTEPRNGGDDPDGGNLFRKACVQCLENIEACYYSAHMELSL